MNRPLSVLRGSFLFILLFILAIRISGAEAFPLALKRLDPWPENTLNENDSEFLYRMVYQQYFRMDARGLRDSGKQPNYSSLVKKGPEKIQCDTPFMDVAKLGDDYFVFVLDSTDFVNEGYDLLYFDINKNGDLTDDRVIKALNRNSSGNLTYINRQFPRIDVNIPTDGISYPYSFFLSNQRNIQQNTNKLSYASVSLRSAAYRSGEIKLEGKKHQFIILDFNSDGRFDTQTSIHRMYRYQNSPAIAYLSSGDMILIDPDLSDYHTTGYSSIDRLERQYLSKLLCIDQRYYQIQITPNGDSVTLTPSAIPQGYLINENNNYQAILYGDQGVIKITGQNSKEVPVPIGKWRLVDYVIEETSVDSERKNSYTYVKANAIADYPEVEVQKGSTVLLPFGPPYKPQVIVSQISRSGSEKKANLSLEIIGQAGEVCSEIQIDNKRPEKPLFAIATPKGKILERGSFEYG